MKLQPHAGIAHIHASPNLSDIDKVKEVAAKMVELSGGDLVEGIEINEDGEFALGLCYVTDGFITVKDIKKIYKMAKNELTK